MPTLSSLNALVERRLPNLELIKTLEGRYDDESGEGIPHEMSVIEFSLRSILQTASHHY